MPTIHPALPANGDDAVVDVYNAALNLILGVLNGAVDIDNLADGAVGLAKLSSAVQGALLPTGSFIAYGGVTPPSGFLMCDGSSYLRASYPALFGVIGTAYGTADGTHFNVPDLRGRVPVGTDNAGGSASNRIQRSTTITTTSGSNSATVGSATGLSRGMVITSTNVPAGTTITVISGTTITMSANASAAGTTIAARFSMIGDANALGSAGGTDVVTLVADQMPSHSHSWLSGNGTWASGGNSGLSLNNAGFNVSAPTSAAGGDQAHPIMQPSQLANYIIKV